MSFPQSSALALRHHMLRHHRPLKVTSDRRDLKPGAGKLLVRADPAENDFSVFMGLQKKDKGKRWERGLERSRKGTLGNRDLKGAYQYVEPNLKIFITWPMTKKRFANSGSKTIT